jgi:hypothetical protein
MNRVETWLAAQGATRRPVEARVAELLEMIRQGVTRFDEESWDQANERHAEEFISALREEFSGRVLEVERPAAFEQHAAILRRHQTAAPGSPPVVVVERQRLKPMARRTTGYNFSFTVPGRSPERLILVAHYDTWRGPGADDNTTGEVICRQYLLDDLRASQPPPCTHTYLFAGSEECGLIGFTSQVLLAAGIGLANMALAKGLFYVTVIGLALVPLANFRFGVSGSREYVASLSNEELALIKSVVSVDSVGEGKMYIPESSLGADFVRAFIPFEGYDALNDLLEEGAHLNGIKYNSFIAGGTTDHISFLEVNSTLRDRIGDLLGCPRWLGCHKRGKRKIPATALVALCPGKASPLVFGGKIHTPADTPDRCYPEPLGEALRILDYWYHLMHGGARIQEPRELDEYHYAQLFRAPGEPEEYLIALKDAVEPNRRNINGVYRVDVELCDSRAVCRNPRIVRWGVETELAAEVQHCFAARTGKAPNAPAAEEGSERQPQGALHDSAEIPRVSAPAEALGKTSVQGVPKFRGVYVEEIELHSAARVLRYHARKHRPLARLESYVRNALGQFERFMGTNTFLTFFGAAFLLAHLVDRLMQFVFAASYDFQQWFFRWFALTLPLTVFVQLTIVLWLIGVKIPTMIDNAYRHLNRADNLRSLRRVSL